MSSRLWVRRIFTASALALLSVGCSDKPPFAPNSLPDSTAEVPPAALVVSDPFLNSQPLAVAAQAVSARSSLVSAAAGEVAYVSLPSGSLPAAVSVTIRNLTTGTAQTPPIPFLNGGFDPVAVVASADDQLELRITSAAGAITLYRVIVPKRRPPGVVRTNPPKGRVDVPLNSLVTVVFTEPVAPATLTAATVQLLRGTAPVPGTVRPVTGSLFAVEFVPDEVLASGTTYRLVVTRGILDADGDSLEAEVASDFTTLTVQRVAPVASVVAGGAHTCALRVDGEALCFGANYNGQLGAGHPRSTIGACPSGGGGTFYCSTIPLTVVGGQSFASLASGTDHTCALTAAGEAWCWGYNHHLSLGADDNPFYCDFENANNRVECSGVPLRVGGGLRLGSVVAGSVVAGYEHTCGIRVGGAAYCWGLGIFGALGIGDASIIASPGFIGTPTAVLGDITFTAMTSGGNHTCGLTSSGAAYCWGSNADGQLGTGGASPDTCRDWHGDTAACAKAPMLVIGGLTFVSLIAGWQNTCGLTPNGRAYCWGFYWDAGSYGAAPAPVNDNLAFVSLSSGSSAGHTCGVTSANVAYCWGTNTSGQLGDGSTTSTLVPVPVTGGLAFSAVAAGGYHSCGITAASAELYCWGDNSAGQFGVGRVSAGSPRPIRVSGQ